MSKNDDLNESELATEVDSENEAENTSKKPLQHDEKPQQGTTNRSSAREQARKITQDQADAEKRKNAMMRWGIVALVAAVLLGLGLYIYNSNKPQGPAMGPANFNAEGGIKFNGSTTAVPTPAVEVKPDTKHEMGQPGAGKPVITMYVDFMCPGCGQFEKTFKDQLKQVVDSGKAEIEYRPLAILDRMSAGTNYSTRALNATACVANVAPNKAWDMLTALFDNQPEENTQGPDDSKLAQLASQTSGQDLTSCVKEGTYKGWTKVVTNNTTDSGLTGTPTVYINNIKWDGKGTVDDAVNQAIAGTLKPAADK